MGRPPLPVGTWGNIPTPSAVPGGYRARVWFRDFDGVTRRVERTGPTKGAARASLTSYLIDRTTPAHDAITGETLLRHVAAVWLSERDDLADNTRRRYREVLADHIEPSVGNLRMNEATVTRLDRFIKTMSENVGPASAKLALSILSGVMGLAVRHGAIRANPIRDVAPVAVESKTVRAMTLDEVVVARTAVGAYVAGTPIVEGQVVRRGRSRADDLLDIVDVMLGTGVRIGEALAIRWEDVDLETGVVTISGTIISGDTKPATLIRQPFRKGRKGKQPVAYKVPPFTLAALTRRRVDMTHANTGDLVFPSQAGTIRDPGNVRKTLNGILEQVGLAWVTPHTFRKTVATLIDAELGARAAADQLDHGNEAVTRKHYIDRPALRPDTTAITARFAPVPSNE